MAVLRSGFLFIVLMGPFVIRAFSPQTGESPPGSFVGFDSAPHRVEAGSVVRVRYRCSGPCQLAVDAVVSTSRETDLVVFRRKWICSTVGVYRTHQVQLRLPPSILYQQNFFNRRVLDAQNVTVRAWLDHLNGGREPGTYHGATLRVYKVLQTDTPSERPVRPPTQCPSWSAHLVWQTNRNRIHRCPHETAVIDMLAFPLASPGENFGLVRKFWPFTNGALERARLRAVKRPSVALSVWIYLLKRCPESVCGVVHHVGKKRDYDSVVMQLTDTGDVIIQARVTTGEDKAFRARAMLPRWRWIRLDCYIQDSKVLLEATWDQDTRRYVYDFHDSIQYDDTEGYFVIGGSKYMPGIRGYYGPIKYYRLGTEQVKDQRRPESTLQELEKTHQECREMEAFTEAFLQEVIESHEPSPVDAGAPLFIRLWRKEKTCWQTWTWEQQLKYRKLFHFLQTREEEIRTGSLDLKYLGGVLFEQAAGAMFTGDQEVTVTTTALLRASSCFGNHKASLLLATVLFSGLDQASVNHQQGHVYSLIGASADDRFSLMHAGYKHTQGIDGFPKDLDMAYSYYSNAAAQSNVDSYTAHENEQHLLEHIYLSNQEDLNSFKHEMSDVFHYLKYQADRGNGESQKRLGAMLYWGQHGVSKDVASAVKWLERSALQMNNPSAMYDYSILLMKGQGVKRNYTQGLRLLEKAAAMGSINALNGLGWYYGIILNDHKNAMKYFKQAALNGSDDGMFNLGLYHLSGANPDSPGMNETAAFLQFLNASRLGHAAGSLEAAWYLSTGSLEGVTQDVERAVIMVKKVCEHNGHLGFMIHEALQAYLRGFWRRALVKYVLAAETGLGLAQSNAAHLCEELNLRHDCQWRYHNYSILNYDPHPSVLLRMGDHHLLASSSSSLGQAVTMYGRAAAAGSPQAMYNLAVLALQGHILPPSVLDLFNASHRDGQDIVEKILKRCVETEEEAEEEVKAMTPCSLTLLRVQMGAALSRMSQDGAQLLLVGASLLSALIVLVTLPLQSRLERGLPARSQSYTGLSRGQNGVPGGRDLRERLRQTCELSVTVSGICLCTFWTTFLYHVL